MFRNVFIPNVYQNGFSLFMSLFVIIVVALLAASIFRMNQTSDIAMAQDVSSVRAFYAAETGAQAMAMDIFPSSGAGVCSNRNINFATNGLTGCRAVIVCNSFVADSETFYSVQSTGECSQVGDYTASRTVDVMLKDI